MAKEKTEIKYEVKKKIGVIADNGKNTLELRIVSWNDKEPKYDIRTWYEDDKGIEKCNKGIQLTEKELMVLGELIKKI